MKGILRNKYPFIFLLNHQAIQSLNLRCRKEKISMTRFLYSILLSILWLGVWAQHGPEVITDLHVHASQYNKSLALPHRPKSIGDTLNFFQFKTLKLPFVEDFSRTSFFYSYQAGTYDVTNYFHYKRFLVDGSYLDNFIGTTDTTYRYVYNQLLDSSWTIVSSVANPASLIQFFNYENPNIPYLEVPYFKNYNTLDSNYLNGTFGSGIQYVDSVVLVNDSFTLAHCSPNDTVFWTDNDVFVNNDYPIQPPTIGVATFDGADSSGVPYDWSVGPNYFPHGKADYLSSAPIDLSEYSEADSIYFSFYYQAQGRGANAPQNIDSLVLQFKDTAGIWRNVWYSEGYSLTGMTEDEQFQFASIWVDTTYYSNSFQFRFLNWATLTGAVDLWHIDMVRLDKNRNNNDKYYLDGAFIYNYHSPLKEYQSVPYLHYSAKNDTSIFMLDSLVTPGFHNQHFNELSLKLFYNMEGDGLGPITCGESNGNLAPGVSCFLSAGCFDVAGGNPFQLPKLNDSYEFPSNITGNDTANYEFKIYSKGVASDLIRSNDTVTFHQKFYNYYAYDDGTAENGYGLNVNNSMLAMRFKIYKQDFLRAVAMYFDPISINFFAQNSPYMFTLKVWTGNEYPENLIYEKDSLKPKFGTSDFFTRINDFAYYYIDTDLVVDTGGYVFIGWQQQTNQVLGLGFDRNINSNENMFYDIQDGNGWYQSQLPGTWMIRPCFGDPFTTPIGMEEKSPAWNFGILPNPANQTIRLHSNQFEFGKKYRAEIKDISGRILINADATEVIQVGELQSGVYLVSVVDNRGVSFKTQKLLVSH